jgi:hypothetical protein
MNSRIPREGKRKPLLPVVKPEVNVDTGCSRASNKLRIFSMLAESIARLAAGEAPFE